jgi:chromosome segregation ATPase
MSNGENISSKLESDLGVLAQENEDLKARVAELESIISAKNIRIDESMKVIHRMRDNSRDLSKVVRESKRRELDLHSELEKKESAIARISESANVYRSRGKELTSKITEARSRIDETKSKNDRLKNLLASKSDEISELNSRIDEAMSRLDESKSRNDRLKNQLSAKNSELARKDEEISRLNKANESLRSKITSINSSNSKLIESKDSELGKTKSKLSESSKQLSSAINRYLKTKCVQENLDYESILESLPKNYSMDDVDRVVKEFANRRDRLNKMPMRVVPRTAVITESSLPRPQEYEEDIQTMSILKNMK